MILTNHAKERFRQRYISDEAIRKIAEKAYTNGNELDENGVKNEFNKWIIAGDRGIGIYREWQGMRFVFKLDGKQIKLITIL